MEDLVSEEELELNPALEKILEERDLVDRLKTLPIWLISLGIHIAVIIVLATFYIGEKQKNQMEVISQPAEEMGVDMDDLDDEESIDFADFDIEVQETQEMVEQPAPAIFSNLETTPDLRLSETYAMDDSAMVAPVQMMMSSALSGRMSGKGRLLKSGGGSAESEKAVQNALKWLAAHQLPNGSWSFQAAGANSGRTVANNAATAMALLPFLGAGHTPSQGDYKATVARGIEFLLTNGKRSPEGYDLRDGGEGRMYSHGLASIVLCEACAMTAEEKDRRYKTLRSAAQQAVFFIQNAQDPDMGGWRYEPKQRGDTSVVGWQLMALKSGDMGGLSIDPTVMKKALNFFIHQVGYEGQSRYGYDKRIGGTDATTSIGLLCRLYLDWTPKNASLLRGADYLLNQGPNFSNPYYVYYATQVLHHIGGPRWTQWNSQVRDTLIGLQVKDGDDFGSWTPQNDDGYGQSAGRLYVTALFCMTLEVYYRHMPLYSQAKFGGLEENPFPLD